MAISPSGVTSPPGMRGTTEYEPSFCRLAITWSLVSCSDARSPSRTWPVPREARIEPITGLQMSQPRPVPCRPMISLNVVSPCTRTTSKSWARDSSKCSHSAVLTSTPDFSSSVVTSCLTSGRQEPQLVPARVHAFTPARSVQPRVGHRAADRAGGDVVARADRRVVGQVASGSRRGPLGQQVCRGVAAQRAADHGAQGGVRAGVADEDAAAQGAGVVGHHELLVDAGDGVGEDDLEPTGLGGEGVTEGRDVDAEQLELGGQVGPGEGALAAQQPVGHDLGHGVAGGDQAEGAAVDARDLADRPDGRVDSWRRCRRRRRRRARRPRGRTRGRARRADGPRRRRRPRRRRAGHPRRTPCARPGRAVPRSWRSPCRCGR